MIDENASNKLEQYMTAVLESIVYHRFGVFQCKTFATVEKVSSTTIVYMLKIMTPPMQIKSTNERERDM